MQKLLVWCGLLNLSALLLGLIGCVLYPPDIQLPLLQDPNAYFTAKYMKDQEKDAKNDNDQYTVQILPSGGQDVDNDGDNDQQTRSQLSPSESQLDKTKEKKQRRKTKVTKQRRKEQQAGYVKSIIESRLPAVQLLNDKGVEAFTKQDFPNACRYLNQAFDMAPADPEIMVNWAACLINHHQKPQDAANVLVDALSVAETIQLSKSEPELLMAIYDNLVRLHEQVGDRRKAAYYSDQQRIIANKLRMTKKTTLPSLDTLVQSPVYGQGYAVLLTCFQEDPELLSQAIVSAVEAMAEYTESAVTSGQIPMLGELYIVQNGLDFDQLVDAEEDGNRGDVDVNTDQDDMSSFVTAPPKGSKSPKARQKRKGKRQKRKRRKRKLMSRHNGIVETALELATEASSLLQAAQTLGRTHSAEQFNHPGAKGMLYSSEKNFIIYKPVHLSYQHTRGELRNKAVELTHRSSLSHTDWLLRQQGWTLGDGDRLLSYDEEVGAVAFDAYNEDYGDDDDNRQEVVDIIFFLDGDDVYYPSHISQALTQFVKDLSLCSFKGAVKFLDIPSSRPTVHRTWYEAIGNTIVSNMVFRRSCFELIGGFPVHLNEREDVVLQRQIYTFTKQFSVLEEYKKEQSKNKNKKNKKKRKLEPTIGYRWRPNNNFDRQLNRFSQPLETSMEIPPTNTTERWLRVDSEHYSIIWQKYLEVKFKALMEIVGLKPEQKRQLRENGQRPFFPPPLIANELAPLVEAAPWSEPDLTRDDDDDDDVETITSDHQMSTVYGIIPFAGAANGDLNEIIHEMDRASELGLSRPRTIMVVPQSTKSLSTGYRVWTKWPAVSESTHQCQMPCAWLQYSEQPLDVDIAIFQCGEEPSEPSPYSLTGTGTRFAYFCMEHFRERFEWVDLSLFDIIASHSLSSDIPHLPIVTDTDAFLVLDSALQSKPNLKSSQDFFSKNILKNREGGVAVVLSNDFATAWNRKGWMEQFFAKIDVHSYGRVLNNLVEKGIRIGNSYHHQQQQHRLSQQEKFDLVYSRYKFVLALENTLNIEDYVSEKLYEPLMLGAVPIYLGADNVDDFIPHPDAIVKISDFAAMDDLVDYIEQALDDDQIFLKHHQWRTQPSSIKELHRIQSKGCYLKGMEAPLTSLSVETLHNNNNNNHNDGSIGSGRSNSELRARGRLRSDNDEQVPYTPNSIGGSNEENWYNPCLFCDWNQRLFKSTIPKKNRNTNKSLNRQKKKKISKKRKTEEQEEEVQTVVNRQKTEHDNRKSDNEGRTPKTLNDKHVKEEEENQQTQQQKELEHRYRADLIDGIFDRDDGDEYLNDLHVGENVIHDALSDFLEEKATASSHIPTEERKSIQDKYENEYEHPEDAGFEVDDKYQYDDDEFSNDDRPSVHHYHADIDDILDEDADYEIDAYIY